VLKREESARSVSVYQDEPREKRDFSEKGNDGRADKVRALCEVQRKLTDVFTQRARYEQEEIVVNLPVITVDKEVNLARAETPEEGEI
jgi:hypothetical protein